MSSLFKYIIIRSVNEHKHRVDVKDMYTFSSFLWLSVGNTLRLSPIVWSKENKGSLQVLQEAIDPLAFCFKLRSGVLLPFLFWRRKNEKKTTDRTFFVFMLLLLLLLFFFFVDFFPCSPDVISNPPSIKKNYAEARHEILQPKSICSKINSRCLGRYRKNKKENVIKQSLKADVFCTWFRNSYCRFSLKWNQIFRKLVMQLRYSYGV